MSKQKIAIFINQLRYGGAERALVQVANGIAEHGHDVDLLIRNLGHSAYLDLLNERVKVRSLGQVSKPMLMLYLLRHQLLDTATLVRRNSLLPMSMRAVPKLEMYLRREEPVALLSTLSECNIAALWARQVSRTHTRVVIREANLISRSIQMRPGLLPHIAPLWYQKADAVVSVCNGVGDDLARALRLPRNSVRTIHNPVDPPRIRELACQKVDHPWLISKSSPVVVTVGRLTKQKDHRTLLLAVAQVVSRRETKLIVIGEGKSRAALEEQAARLGLRQHVDFIGHHTNPYAFMARADLFVLSSLWEGLPNVLLEALACGSPVVSTDCEGGGAREILLDGRLGRLVPPANPEALATAILETLDQKRQDDDKALRTLERFSPDIIIEKYLDVLLNRPS